MLVKPTIAPSQDLIGSVLAKMTAGNSRPEGYHEVDGYVLMAHWNPEFNIPEIARNRNRWMDENYKNPLYDMEVPSYGVCDSVEQFHKKFGKELQDHTESFIVTFVEIRRDQQDSWGGWRYHKWGDYVGDQNPQHEYLYDDKHIDVVFTFSVYHV